jgi:hypothetical protein
MWPIRQGNPDRVNYNTLFPVAEGVRDYCAQDSVRASHIRVVAPPIRRPSALVPPPTQGRRRLGRIVDTRADLAHHLMNLLALGGTLDHESAYLTLQVRAILRREHTRLDGDPLGI